MDARDIDEPSLRNDPRRRMDDVATIQIKEGNNHNQFKVEPTTDECFLSLESTPNWYQREAHIKDSHKKLADRETDNPKPMPLWDYEVHKGKIDIPNQPTTKRETTVRNIL